MNKSTGTFYFISKMFSFCQPVIRQISDNKQKVLDNYPKYGWLIEKLGKLESLNYNEVCELFEVLCDFQNYYCKSMHFFMVGRRPYDGDIDKVVQRKKELVIQNNPSAKKYYELPSNITTKEETVNGYKLYDIIDVGEFMDYEMFMKLRKHMKAVKTVTKEDFYEWYSEFACSDWAKMDRDGEPFGSSFWKDGVDKAYDLTRDDNFEGLWELPYPKELIKETIFIGCGNRRECVRYSNFICEFIKRAAEEVFAP